MENNFLGMTSSDKLDKAVEKIKNGDKSLATTNELIKPVIKQTVGDDNPAANLMAHAALNAALAKGDNAVAGAAGAAIGEATGMISQAYYGKPASELTESERQTVSAGNAGRRSFRRVDRRQQCGCCICSPVGRNDG